jgi:hypothetical protein
MSKQKKIYILRVQNMTKPKAKGIHNAFARLEKAIDIIRGFDILIDQETVYKLDDNEKAHTLFIHKGDKYKVLLHKVTYIYY